MAGRLQRLHMGIGSITHLLPYLRSHVPNTFMFSHARVILDQTSEDKTPTHFNLKDHEETTLQGCMFANRYLDQVN